MGGEKAIDILTANAKEGSPPRGRGKVLPCGQRSGRPGITPAWAGKSRTIHCRGDHSWDHPRVGGEKPDLTGAAFGEPGITPAWAGKRNLGDHPTKVIQDHPRVGGEKGLGGVDWGLPRGSPPRGRGKVFHAGPGGRCTGITPAWAGKSRRRPTQGWIFRDHPRVGGEKFLYHPPQQGKAGITPAWAGKRLVATAQATT